MHQKVIEALCGRLLYGEAWITLDATGLWSLVEGGVGPHNTVCEDCVNKPEVQMKILAKTGIT